MNADPARGAVLLRAGARRPVVVTMLVDPLAPVHAVTGILPVKAIDLPRAHYGDALAKLGVLLRAGPVLAPAGGVPGVPVPRRPGGGWFWYAPDGTRHPLPDAAAAPAARLERQEILDGWLRPGDAPAP